SSSSAPSSWSTPPATTACAACRSPRPSWRRRWRRCCERVRLPLDEEREGADLLAWPSGGHARRRPGSDLPRARRRPRRRRPAARTGARDRQLQARERAMSGEGNGTNGNGLVQLTAKDLKTDQEVRWCPGCGDYAILAAMQSFMP